MKAREVCVGTESFTVLNAAAVGRYTVSVVEDTGDVYAWRTNGGAVAPPDNGGRQRGIQCAPRRAAGWLVG